jgi:hypothetical protein
VGINVLKNKSIVLAVRRRAERIIVIETLFIMIVKGETGPWREGEQRPCPSASDHPRRPSQHGNTKHNAIHRKRRKPALADPSHEPSDGSVGDDEGDDKADGEDDPLVRCDLGDADGILVFAAERLQERVERGHRHGWDGEEEGELERHVA